MTPFTTPFTTRQTHPKRLHRKSAKGRIRPEANFNGKLRNECLNQHWFSNLAEAKLLIEAWRQNYNQLRPHSAIGGMPPDLFAKKSLTH